MCSKLKHHQQLQKAWNPIKQWFICFCFDNNTEIASNFHLTDNYPLSGFLVLYSRTDHQQLQKAWNPIKLVHLFLLWQQHRNSQQLSLNWQLPFIRFSCTVQQDWSSAITKSMKSYKTVVQLFLLWQQHRNSRQLPLNWQLPFIRFSCTVQQDWSDNWQSLVARQMSKQHVRACQGWICLDNCTATLRQKLQINLLSYPVTVSWHQANQS